MFQLKVLKFKANKTWSTYWRSQLTALKKHGENGSWNSTRLWHCSVLRKDHYISQKFSRSKFTIFIFYVVDVLLTSNGIGFLQETKRMLFETFEMKDLYKASFVLGSEIHKTDIVDYWVYHRRLTLNLVLNSMDNNHQVKLLLKRDRFSKS